MEEIWKDIKNYEEKYQVSNIGRVKIKENITQRMNMGVLRNYKQKEIIMKPQVCYERYLKVSLTDKNGVSKNMAIHRLVATHFIDNKNNYPMVNHIDGDTTNNRVDNLEWCTNSMNITHAIEKLGFKPNTKGISPPSPVVQIDIKTGEVVNEFETISKAMKETGVKHISCVCRGKRKSAGGFFWKYK